MPAPDLRAELARNIIGDGKHDLLWRDANTGTVAIWLLDGLQVLQTGSLGAVPSHWLIATTGDYLKA